MATMYALFFGVLLTAVCCPVGTGDGTVNEIKEKGSKNKDSKFHDGVIEKSNLTATAKLEYQYEENPILAQASACALFSAMQDEMGKEMPINGQMPDLLRHDVKMGGEVQVRIASVTRTIVSVRPRVDLLPSEDQGRGVSVLIAIPSAQCKSSLSSASGIGKETLDGASGMERAVLHRGQKVLIFAPLCIKTKWLGPSDHEDEKPCAKETKEGREVPIIRQMPDLLRHDVERDRIVQIATAELGVREATGNNDGRRVEEYLRYTGLGRGHAWCAAFVSWCFGQAGRPEPRNPWSPALFPNAKTYWKQGRKVLSKGQMPDLLRHDGEGDKIVHINTADLFGIYGVRAKRINHVGLVREAQDKYLITIEGNSNNRVESRRRHLSTIYALADWL